MECDGRTLTIGSHRGWETHRERPTVGVLCLIGAIALVWRPWQQPRSNNTATSTATSAATTTTTSPSANTSLAPSSPPPPPRSTSSTTVTTQAASGPTLGEPCSDFDKLAYDRNAGENLGLIVCGSNTSGPTAKLMWVEAPLVNSTHVAGTPCPGVDQGTVFSRSTDDYLLFCLSSDNGRAYLPGGRTVTVGVDQCGSSTAHETAGGSPR